MFPCYWCQLESLEVGEDGDSNMPQVELACCIHVPTEDRKER